MKALAIKEKTLGAEHPSTATLYNNIGWVYRGKGDYITALNYYSNAYQLLKNIFGDEHPHTMSVLNSINEIKKAMKLT